MTRIAIVEDNPDNRLLLRAILEHRYDVSEYDNGPAALQGFASRRPDVILLDISLPGMDGLEVMRNIRSDAKLAKVPVIALTAHAMPADRERFLQAGFDEYVAKPITDDEELMVTIERLLNG